MEFQNRVLVNQVSLVEQLKELVRAQNESLRHKEAEIKTVQAENARLLGRVAELERENDELKARLDKQHERNYVLSGINRLTGEITPQTRYESHVMVKWEHVHIILICLGGNSG